MPVSFFGAAKVMPFFFFPNFFDSFFKLFLVFQKSLAVCKSGCKDIVFIFSVPNLFESFFILFDFGC
jgi:hypothetical protein